MNSKIIITQNFQIGVDIKDKFPEVNNTGTKTVINKVEKEKNIEKKNYSDFMSKILT